MTDSIPKKVLQSLGQIVVETGKETLIEANKITSSIVTGQELLGIKPLSDEDLAKRLAEDDKNKQEEMRSLREPGRNVEEEIKQVIKEKEQKEESAEEKMLREVREQREAEERERQQLEVQMGVSNNPNKQKKQRGSAFVKGKRKTQQPDPVAMSQTAEKSGKME
jgi:hypothetical protein